MMAMLAFIGLISIILLVALLIFKMDRIKVLQGSVDKLQRSLNETDEQAKLIIRTDIELNKTQEELDKKISGLYSLQKLSRSISTTLEENQIFKALENTSLEELGFERMLVFIWNDKTEAFNLRAKIGYSEEEVNAMGAFILKNKTDFMPFMQQGDTLSFLSRDPLAEKIRSELKKEMFVVSAILPKEGSRGLLVVSSSNPELFLTESDEDLIKILANELGQVLDNARLFEKTWRAQQELEQKVEERTRELTRALEEIKKVSKRKSDFIASVSHELRTPLTSIKGYASILLSGSLGNIPKEAQERIDKINKHSDELVHFINELLDISRIESGKVIMKMMSADLSSLIAKVTDLLMVQAKNKNIDLTAKVDSNAKEILVDIGQIERVFINLIGNAIKFTPPKGKITIRGSLNKDLIQVDISDTGCGIPPEAKEAIFEEFYRVDNSINQDIKGTGLGLTLVKHIIELHGGRIWVDSTVGKGSTFSFTLPKPK